MEPILKLDFRKDLVEFYRSELTGWGYIIPSGDDDRQISFKYFNVMKRRIEPMPRVVLDSRELAVPTAERAGFDALCVKMRQGADINPHLSKRLLELDYHDSMLNDWGIHHFHLGINPTADGFIERKGPLAYAVVNENAVHMINIYPHMRWANKELLEIIDGNWPHLLDRYRLKNVIDIEFDLTEKERLALRGKPNKRMKRGKVIPKVGAVNVPLRLASGSIVAPPGGGATTSGHSIEAMLASNHFFKLVRSWENGIRENGAVLIAELERKGVTVGPEIELSFVVAGNNNYFAEERSSGLRIPLVMSNP